MEDHNNLYQPQPTEPIMAEEPKPKKNHSAKAPIALVLIFSLLASTLLGLGGGIFGYYFMNMRQNQNASPEDGSSGDILINSTPIELSEESYNRAEVVQKVYSSVVEITTSSVNTSMFMPQRVLSGAGSGVIITTDGYIVTNHHVVDGASGIEVGLANGKTYKAQLVASDAKTDLAVIKIEANDLSAATFGDSSRLVVGQTVLAIGNPLGSLGGTVTEGIISALDREIAIEKESMTLLQISAAVNPGNSGGGLFDEQGNLIGIVNAKVSTDSSGDPIEGLGFAIPANIARKVSGELMDHGYVTGRVELGVTLIHIADERTAMMYRVSKTGIYILQVESNSNAANAGLRSGDYLARINDTDITSSADVEKILENISPGDTIRITIERGGEEKTVDVFMAESTN
jgi:serine protease Do